MKSILDQFAADAINAPVAITGGGAPCGKGSNKPKTQKPASSKPKTNKSKSNKSGGGCYCPPPPCH